MRLRPHEIALGIVRGDFDACDGVYPDPRNFFTPEEAVNFLEDFTGESVMPSGKLTIYAGRRRNGYLQLDFRGHVDPETRHRIRNFLIVVM